MWTKICGVRDEATAKWVADCGPTAIGLNFYARSPRSVDPAMAARIVNGLPPEVEPVGVFVNVTPDAVPAVADVIHACQLPVVQLHGNEPPAVLGAIQRACPEVRLIRSWSMPADWSQLTAYLAECRQLGVALSAVLMDSQAPGLHGGTGIPVDWQALRRDYRTDVWPPLALAGGLTPDNVAEAIRCVRPWGVDVASGVESSRGVKDPDRVRRFLAAVRDSSRERCDLDAGSI